MLNIKDKISITDTQKRTKQKRMGQFFTGERLAKLLFALSGVKGNATIIDPMCGTGDMLYAAKKMNPRASITGIEIDKEIIHGAKHLPRNAQVIIGDAFDIKNLDSLKDLNFDLVITNPPYVRYQSMGESGKEDGIPSALEIRNNLLKSADLLIRDKEDNRLFKELIREYSGLSDLAVPSWILSAMLTKTGGTLALVVPESWLSRDYAKIIHYMLFRWFKIRYIVEDSNACWFSGATIKTTLLVAERIDRRNSAFDWENEYYAHIRLSAETADHLSIVGNLYPNTLSPELKFANDIEFFLNQKKEKKTPIWSFRPIKLSEVAENLQHSINDKLWLRKCESIYRPLTSCGILPIELKQWAGSNPVLGTLKESGVLIGQGLRTGANIFFYTNLINENDSNAVVAPNPIFGITEVNINVDSLRTVLRKQIELPANYKINKNKLSGRVLLLREDNLNVDLKRLLRIAAKTRVNNRLIPTLSAVRTNIRLGFTDWYTLPTLASRHTPLLLIPRVNGKLPKTYLNNSKIVVDANFSTIWLEPDSSWSKWSLLAFFNSTWSIAHMELLGSVMGGGALKLEATHLRRISLPNLNRTQIKALDRYGRELVKTNNLNILKNIDELIVGMFFKKERVSLKLKELNLIIMEKLNERRKRL